MKQIKLSPRLHAVAGYVQKNAAVADVGTDHGFIPVWLAQNGIARRIIASDINEGPLDNARTSAQAYGAAEKIEFVKTDGLRGLDPTGIDTVILAGMGGDTIRAILESALWTRTRNVHCILQPQSKCDELSCWLGGSGYRLKDALLAQDDGRLYIVLSVRAGVWRETALEILFRRRDVLLPDYLEHLAAKQQRVVDGLQKAVGRDEAELAQHSLAYEALKNMREETKTWQR